VIEAVRQLRGEAHPAVQVPGCDIALASGPGLVFGIGHSHSTLLLERLA
jgi:acetyl-CoA C-acetyltransferase